MLNTNNDDKYEWILILMNLLQIPIIKRRINILNCKYCKLLHSYGMTFINLQMYEEFIAKAIKI